jgi:protease PrsW
MKNWELFKRLFVVVLLMLTQLIAPIFSDGDLTDFAVTLDADIKIQDNVLISNPGRVAATINITNPEDDDWIIYLIVENENGEWYSENVLGVVQQHSRSVFDIDFEVRYSGLSKVEKNYAVVARGGILPQGKYFTLVQDWSEYETASRADVSTLAKFVVPLAVLFIAGLIVFLTVWGAASSQGAKYSKEYTIRNFFFPHLKDIPFGEMVADLMINPFVWTVQILLIFLLAGSLMTAGKIVDEHLISVIIMGLLGAIIMPLVYLTVVWVQNEIVERMPLRFLAGSFIYGAIAAIISLVLNSIVIKMIGPLTGLESTAVMLISTIALIPIVEEVVKASGLLLLWNHHQYSDSLHGLHIGFAVGLGFAFVENWFYFASKTDPLHMGIAPWIGFIIYRSFFNSIAHASFSATFGGIMGWSKNQGWHGFAMLALVPAIITAAVLHSIFNITAIMDGYEAIASKSMVYEYNPTMVITLASIMLVLFVIATVERRYDRRKIEYTRKKRK